MTASDTHTDPERRPDAAVSPVRVLTAALVLASMAAGTVVWALAPTGDQSGALVACLLIAAGFAASEVFVVHVQVRRDSHSFSLSEVPLVVGLYLVSPRGLLVGALVGVGLALVLHRHQPVIKLVFNLAKLTLEIAVAVTIFRAADPVPGIPGGKEVWVTFAATIAASIIGAVLVSLAIAASERSWKDAGFRATLPISLLGTTTATSLGLITVVMVDAAPGIVWLLLFPVAGCYGLYSAWTKQTRRTESLQFLYRTAQLLQEHASVDEATVTLLAETRTVLRARSVDLVYRAGDGGQPLRATFGAEGDGALRPATDAEMDELVATLAGTDEARLVIRRAHGTDPGHPDPNDGELSIIAPLVTGEQTVGALVIGPPLGDVARFGEEERRLVDTTAHALSAALENGSLERSLAQMKTIEQELTHLAHHDPLTELPNRTRFIERVAEAASPANSASGSFALLFIDLDDFKFVNDSLGHDIGDALLVEVGRRISLCLRPGDLAARLGGDEFAVLLEPVEGPAEAKRVAGEILGALSRPVVLGGHSMGTAASIGVALGEPGADVAEVLKGADVAMYEAKAAGKGQVACLQDGEATRLSSYELLRGIEVAGDRGELSVDYQPVVRLTDESLDSLEALIRWDHGERGRVPPAGFVRLAEMNRGIDDITRLVLRDACSHLQRHSPEVLPGISINLSRRGLRIPDFIEDAHRVLAETGVEPRRLVCEISESMLLEGEAILSVRALQELGVRISIHDFGAQSCSIQRLRELALDQIKIAHPFVGEVDREPRDLEVVRGIVTLGKALGLDVVARGVEREMQLTALRAAGCHAVQGYLIARPMPGGELEGYLAGTGGRDGRGRPAAWSDHPFVDSAS